MAFSRAAKFTLAVLLIAFPWISDSFTAYQLGLYLLYGMVAQGIALCWGRAGFLPLGQALFFGIGAYLSGAALKADLGWALLLPAFAVACLVPALLAGFIGALVFNRQTGSGPYFSLITLALSMLGFQLANSLSGITGGFNGMTGIPGLPGVDTYETLYFVIVGVLTASTLVLAHVMRAPFGQLLIAIRENEERLQFFGFRTSMLKAAAFAISGGIAGLAGALYAPHQGIVTPQAVGFVLSAELLIWTAVGGRFGLIGPVAGAVLIGFMAAGLRDSFRYWEVAVALVFILVVLKMPGGSAGCFPPRCPGSAKEGK
jgi:branched-chain amino acid transport system permease protein